MDCYAQFVQGTGKTVVIGFDTVEAIRGTYLLVTLTQWMKALPSTLFILSGARRSTKTITMIPSEANSRVRINDCLSNSST